METMPPPLEGDPIQSRTERGLRWLVLALGLSLTADVVLLVPVWFLLEGPVVHANAWVFVSLVADLLFAAAAASGFVGFRRVRQGRSEYSTDHEADVRRGSVAFVLGAGSALALTLSGLVLSFVYVPGGAYVTTTSGAGPALVAVGETIRAVHRISAPAIIPLVGLFLLWSIWHISGSAIRFVAAGAFALGLVAAVWSAISTLVLLVSLPTSWGFALSALPVASLILWLVAYLLVILRIRGLRATVASNAAAA